MLHSEPWTGPVVSTALYIYGKNRIWNQNPLLKMVEPHRHTDTV